MSHELYLRVLSAMFLFWNGARVLTYIPTIGKLLARGADVRSYSLLSWGSWALSNGTFALMLLEMSRGIPNRMFWMNLANTLMCLVVSFIILLRRFPRLHARANMVYRKIRRNDSKRAAVSGPAGVQHSGAGSPNAEADLEGKSVPAVPPARFVWRAHWLASASVLAVGVAGAFAYGVWFNHDQRGYVEAKASARPALGITGPTSPTQQTSSSSHVPLPSLLPARGTAVASAEPAPPGSSARFDHRAAPSADSDPRHLATARPGRVNPLATQKRRHSASHVMASARQALGIAGPTSPTQQTSSSPHVALSSSPPRGTAVTISAVVPPASSAPFHHRAAPSPDSAAPQLARVRPGPASYFATQNRRHSASHVPAYVAPPPFVYEAPRVVYQRPPVVYQEPPVVYAPAPAVYGYAYEGEYRDRRHWHDNGWHKGWQTHHHEDDDE